MPSAARVENGTRAAFGSPVVDHSLTSSPSVCAPLLSRNQPSISTTACTRASPTYGRGYGAQTPTSLAGGPRTRQRASARIQQPPSVHKASGGGGSGHSHGSRIASASPERRSFRSRRPKALMLGISSPDRKSV